MQYTRQRQSSPDYGLKEEILLPWYQILQSQYTAKPWNGWGEGNATLNAQYEQMAIDYGQKRFYPY